MIEIIKTRTLSIRECGYCGNLETKCWYRPSAVNPNVGTFAVGCDRCGKHVRCSTAELAFDIWNDRLVDRFYPGLPGCLSSDAAWTECPITRTTTLAAEEPQKENKGEQNEDLMQVVANDQCIALAAKVDDKSVIQDFENINEEPARAMKTKYLATLMVCDALGEDVTYNLVLDADNSPCIRTSNGHLIKLDAALLLKVLTTEPGTLFDEVEKEYELLKEELAKKNAYRRALKAELAETEPACEDLRKKLTELTRRWEFLHYTT